MGVYGITSLIKQHFNSFCRRIEFSSQDTETPQTVVVDGNAFAYWICGDTFDAPPCVFTNYSSLSDSVKRWHAQFVAVNVKLIYIFDGPTEANKLDCKFRRLRQQFDSTVTYMKGVDDCVSDERMNPGYMKAVLPLLAVQCIVETLSELSAAAYYTPGEADSILVQTAKAESAVAILSNDTDLLMYEMSARMIPLDSIACSEDGSVCAYAVDRVRMASIMKIAVTQYPTLAALCGNDFSDKFSEKKLHDVMMSWTDRLGPSTASASPSAYRRKKSKKNASGKSGKKKLRHILQIPPLISMEESIDDRVTTCVELSVSEDQDDNDDDVDGTDDEDVGVSQEVSMEENTPRNEGSMDIDDVATSVDRSLKLSLQTEYQDVEVTHGTAADEAWRVWADKWRKATETDRSEKKHTASKIVATSIRILQKTLQRYPSMASASAEEVDACTLSTLLNISLGRVKEILAQQQISTTANGRCADPMPSIVKMLQATLQRTRKQYQTPDGTAGKLMGSSGAPITLQCAYKSPQYGTSTSYPPATLSVETGCLSLSGDMLLVLQEGLYIARPVCAFESHPMSPPPSTATSVTSSEDNSTGRQGQASPQSKPETVVSGASPYETLAPFRLRLYQHLFSAGFTSNYLIRSHAGQVDSVNLESGGSSQYQTRSRSSRAPIVTEIRRSHTSAEADIESLLVPRESTVLSKSVQEELEDLMTQPPRSPRALPTEPPYFILTGEEKLVVQKVLDAVIDDSPLSGMDKLLTVTTLLDAMIKSLTKQSIRQSAHMYITSSMVAMLLLTSSRCEYAAHAHGSMAGNYLSPKGSGLGNARAKDAVIIAFCLMNCIASNTRSGASKQRADRVPEDNGLESATGSADKNGHEGDPVATALEHLKDASLRGVSNAEIANAWAFVESHVLHMNYAFEVAAKYVYDYQTRERKGGPGGDSSRASYEEDLLPALRSLSMGYRVCNLNFKRFAKLYTAYKSYWKGLGADGRGSLSLSREPRSASNASNGAANKPMAKDGGRSQCASEGTSPVRSGRRISFGSSNAVLAMRLIGFKDHLLSTNTFRDVNEELLQCMTNMLDRI